jgi:hypothetical protein
MGVNILYLYLKEIFFPIEFIKMLFRYFYYLEEIIVIIIL